MQIRWLLPQHYFCKPEVLLKQHFPEYCSFVEKKNCRLYVTHKNYNLHFFLSVLNRCHLLFIIISSFYLHLCSYHTPNYVTLYHEWLLCRILNIFWYKEIIVWFGFYIRGHWFVFPVQVDSSDHL